jgi:hypothetical protein
MHRFMLNTVQVPPFLVAGVSFAILFTFYRVFQATRKGSMFLIPLIIGGFCLFNPSAFLTL